MIPTTAIPIVFYILSAMFSGVYLAFAFSLSRDPRSPNFPPIQLCFMVSLLICFTFRVIYFGAYGVTYTPIAETVYLIGFALLILSKFSALAIWQEAVLAFTARGGQAFVLQRARFRKMVLAYVIFVFLQTIGLIVWLFAVADWNGNENIDVPNNTADRELFLTFVGTWIAAQSLLGSIGAFYFGLRLFLYVRAYNFNISGNRGSFQKLGRLNVGAGVMCVTFALRGLFDLLDSFDPNVHRDYYDSSVMVRNVMEDIVLLLCELAPNVFFQVVLWGFMWDRRQKVLTAESAKTPFNRETEMELSNQVEPAL